MKIIVAGGTGFLGRALVTALSRQGHEVLVLSRRPDSSGASFSSSVHTIGWDASWPGPWTESFSSVDAVINLAGEPIANGRWTRTRKETIRSSRICATRGIVDALRVHSTKPCTLVNASGIGYYGPSQGEIVQETAEPGSGFLADLCVDWEREACRAEALGVRVVRLRIGMVLEKDGGALPRMMVPFKLFVGGPMLPGDQWISWIHRADLIRLIEWVLVTPSVAGAVNAVAPDPVPMSRFCSVLGEVLHRPSWLPVPEWALKTGLGELGSLMTTGQRVMPTVALEGGFQFRFPTVESALRAVLKGEQHGAVAR
ncbi:MAG: TIGR01777 family oxidoreductase [Nitrospiraceae bacterium]